MSRLFRRDSSGRIFYQHPKAGGLGWEADGRHDELGTRSSGPLGAELPETESRSILDLGCGGGANLAVLLKLCPDGTAVGLDYSSVSVKKASAVNCRAIAEGRCQVIQGNVQELPFADDSFEQVTAFETIYFWPGLEKCFAEVARILKPNGYFMIVNESDGLDATSQKFEKIIDGMKIYTAEQIESALKSAGFSKVKTDHHRHKPWITILAKK